MLLNMPRYNQFDNAASKLKPNGLLTVILTYAALSDVTQTSFTVFGSCKQDF